MSNETKKTESKFSIVNAVMRLLKLDDAGHIDKFFAKEVKRFKHNIKIHEANQSQLELTYSANRDALTSQIEDGEDNLHDAKLAIDPEAIKDNAAIDTFRTKYWNNITDKESMLDSLKEQLKDFDESHQDALDAVKLEIKDIEEDIEMIMTLK